jgi:hypothetical protein
MTANSPNDGEPVRAAALHCAFEELLDQVLDCERGWQLMDRIDLDIRIQAQRTNRPKGGHG